MNGSYLAARADGLMVRSFDGTDSVDWWCKVCDGRRPHRLAMRRVDSDVDANVEWVAHRRTPEHEAAFAARARVSSGP